MKCSKRATPVQCSETNAPAFIPTLRNINAPNTKMFVSVLNENLFHYVQIVLYGFNPANVLRLLFYFFFSVST